MRAELPGMDPDKDITVSAANGLLTIHAERRDEEKAVNRTEFPGCRSVRPAAAGSLHERRRASQLSGGVAAAGGLSALPAG